MQIVKPCPSHARLGKPIESQLLLGSLPNIDPIQLLHFWSAVVTISIVFIVPVAQEKHYIKHHNKHQEGNLPR